jgi:hypothetical protein
LILFLLKSFTLVISRIEDIYMGEIGKHTMVDDMFARLKQTIDIEIQYQMDLMQVIGTLGTIFVAQTNAK